MVIGVGLGEGERLTNVAGQPLPQGVVPPLHVRRLPRVFPHLLVGLGGEDRPIRLPEVAEARTGAIPLRDLMVELSTGRLASVPDDEGDDLSGPPTHRRPEPSFGFAPTHERADLVQLQHVARLRFRHGLFEGRHRLHPFFSQSARV